MCVQASPGMMMWQPPRDRNATGPVAIMLDPACVDEARDCLATLHIQDTAAARSPFDRPVGDPPHLTQLPQDALSLVRPALIPPCCCSAIESHPRTHRRLFTH